MPEYLQRWLGHPLSLALSLALLAGDIVTVVSWITGAGGILRSWELHLFLLIVLVPLTVLSLCAWVEGHPRRPRNKFRALHDDLVACCDSIGLDAPTSDSGLRAMGYLADLGQKLRRLGVHLEVRDFSQEADRIECVGHLVVLASLASVGDLKEAREYGNRHRSGS